MKFFALWKRKKSVHELYLRIDNCRSTISQVTAALTTEQLDPAVASRFRELQRALQKVDVAQLRERDMQKIEKATNKLLADFRSLYLVGKLKNIHEGFLH
ncbi:MAG: hypothetical protein JRJ12_11800 [Deltaproteobacteria bacterium]|nr:hypothetical protein [Deltaproteobacteria bacterium]MBW2071200.1 hypothetical protein [Deltaproteobacteria bacterium]